MPLNCLCYCQNVFHILEPKTFLLLNLPGPHIGFLLLQVWSQLQANIVIWQPRTMVAFTSWSIMSVTGNDHPLFNFLYERAVCLLFGTDVVFPARYSYVLTSFFIGTFFRLVYRFWCKAPHFRLQPRRETLYHTRNTSYSLMCYWDQRTVKSTIG